MLLPATGTALPLIASLQDCADFSKTVAPFLPQLNKLPYDIAAHITDRDALTKIYLTTNPAITSLAFSIFLAPVFLVLSEAARNYSQVDRMWPILPLIYNAHYTLWARMNGLPSKRLDHILAFTTIWSFRLAYNYYRKGGYSWSSEDYRWAIVKKYVGPTWMFIFNVVFISTIQSLLLCAITAPSYVLLLVSRVKGLGIETSDSVFTRTLMGIYLIEFFADQQQWHYQQAKKEYRSTAKVPSNFAREELDRGFVTSGLWAFSRHPNFAAEQAIWVTQYLWSCYATGTYINWSVGGAIGLLLVFQGSTWLTELLTTNKYPEYKEYQNNVGRLLPRPTSLLGGAKGIGSSKTRKE